MTEKDKNLENNTAEPQGDAEEQVCECAEQLEREKAQLTQQLLRLRADFENYRRRMANQMQSIELEANEKLLTDLLPILDNFERALQLEDECNEEQEAFFQGVKMVYDGLMIALKKHGLTPIEAVGEPFDPRWHEAVAMEGEGDDLCVLAQIQTGYFLHDKVLRHTKVLVGQNEEEEE